MSQDRRDLSITLLHWILGVALLLGSWTEISHARAAGRLAHAGLAAAQAHAGPPPWLRLSIACSEIVAAILFLVPATVRVGALALLAVLGVAALVHLLHGSNPASLVAYMAAVYVILEHRGGGREDAADGPGGWPIP
jgi:hypothetical protein